MPELLLHIIKFNFHFSVVIYLHIIHGFDNILSEVRDFEKNNYFYSNSTFNSTQSCAIPLLLKKFNLNNREKFEKYKCNHFP